MRQPIVIPHQLELCDRPFTHSAHSHAELATLRQSVATVSALIADDHFAEQESLLARLEYVDNAQLSQRIVLNRRIDLRTLPVLEVVGFFGQRRRTADRAALAAIDEELLAELHDHVDIACYFTRQLPSYDYGNLVLFRTPAAKQHWMNSLRHVWAVRHLAPECYHSIRLHNGVLPRGLWADGELRLTCTKYFDYDLGCDDGVPWRAIRFYEPPLTLTVHEAQADRPL